MNLNLARRLIEKKAIRAGSEMEAMYQSPDTFGVGSGKLRGLFTVVGARMAPDGRVTFLVRGYKTFTETLRIPCEDVLLVDGMAPARLAASTNLTIKGDDVPLGKRRGRPPGKRVNGG